jgi:hypothetical protein
MKKLLVLSVLLGLLTLPVFAEHASIDFGGDDTFGFMTDFGDAALTTLDLTWDVIVGIDDYNSFTWSLKGLTDPLANLALDKALTTTDVGMWLGLPVGLHINWGYDDPDANEFGDVSGNGNQTYDFSPAEYWGLDFIIAISMLEVEIAFNPLGSEGGFLLAGLAVKEPVAGLNAEVYYFQGGAAVAGDDFSSGAIGVGAAYATEVSGIGLEAGVSFEADLGADTWDWGFGLVGAVSMFEISVNLGGDDAEVFDIIGATVDVSAMEMLAIYAAISTQLSAADALVGVDLGIDAHIGAVEMYVGYMITSVGAGAYNAPDELTDGGFYVKFDTDY